MPSYRGVINDAQKQCIDKEINDQLPLMLMVELSDLSHHNLYMEYEEEIDDKLLETFNNKLALLLENKPLAQILGYEDFYGYRFNINEDVLIPRPETEELVANVLADYDEYFQNQKVTLADVGCGSGAIAISLKKEEDNLEVYATDISDKALEVAKENAKKLDADVTFMQGDMLQPLIDKNIKLDILVSNPPYIPQEEELEVSVVDYEPHVALFGGNDGLKFYRSILEKAHLVLKDKSIMAFEMGYDQKERLSNLVKEYFPQAEIKCLKDINGKNRMLFVYQGF